MKYPWLFVGAKVVCVDAVDRKEPGCSPWSRAYLARGEIYTVTWAGEFDHPRLGTALCVFVAETEITPWLGGRLPFSAGRFRPLIDATHQVTAMRELMQKAARTQKMDA